MRGPQDYIPQKGDKELGIHQVQAGEYEGDSAVPDEQKKPPEAKVLKIGKIVVDRDLCIGAASCIAVAPGVFELDSENKAIVYNDKGADAETILLAAKSCPTQAILVFDEEGNQIFP